MSETKTAAEYVAEAREEFLALDRAQRLLCAVETLAAEREPSAMEIASLRSALDAEKQRADAAEAALAEERRGRKSDCATLALVRAALRGMGYALDKAHADLVAERHAHGLTEGERREAMRLLANALLAAHGAPALVGTCVQMTTPHTLSDHVQVYRHACEWAALAATKEKSDE